MLSMNGRYNEYSENLLAYLHHCLSNNNSNGIVSNAQYMHLVIYFT